jgi:hypothetical protein
MKKKKPNYDGLLAQLAALGLLIVVNVVVYVVITHKTELKNAVIEAKLDRNAIADALKAYGSAYAVLPTNSDIPTLGRILSGEDVNGQNPRRLEFLKATDSVTLSNVLVDAWGTPYQIKFLGPKSFSLRSAGRNRQLGDKDDIVFTNVPVDFVKP